MEGLPSTGLISQVFKLNAKPLGQYCHKVKYCLYVLEKEEEKVSQNTIMGLTFCNPRA